VACEESGRRLEDYRTEMRAAATVPRLMAPTVSPCVRTAAKMITSGCGKNKLEIELRASRGQDAQGIAQMRLATRCTVLASLD
jgi:hypothetical protein